VRLAVLSLVIVHYCDVKKERAPEVSVVRAKVRKLLPEYRSLQQRSSSGLYNTCLIKKKLSGKPPGFQRKTYPILREGARTYRATTPAQEHQWVLRVVMEMKDDKEFRSKELLSRDASEKNEERVTVKKWVAEVVLYVVEHTALQERITA